LAVMKPAGDKTVATEDVAAKPVIDALDDLFGLNAAPSDQYNIVVTARPRGSVPTALWSCSYFVFLQDKVSVGVLPGTKASRGQN
jgi:hypothetical protein